MSQFLTRLGITTLHKLGRCAFCMRAAFVSAAFVWLFAFLVQVVIPNRIVAVALMIAASALSILWLAHLTAYAVRSARCKVSTVTIDVSGTVTKFSRRDLVPFFVRTFALAAVATVLPVLFTSARADEGCSGDTPYACGTQYCCSGSAVWHCKGYTGSVENWRQEGSFCTNANSDEDIADLRSNCAELVAC